MSSPLSPFSIHAPGRMAGRVLCLAAAVAAVAFVAAGCGDDGPGTRANQPPTAELTSGPVQGETTLYRIRIFWTGSDPDGFVSHYEYAVDPPSAFTEAEIADPANAPGLQTHVLPGPGENQDTLRVSKVVEGETYTFDWVQSLAFNRQFTFSATEADSTGEGYRVPTGRFTGMHAVYVRSVDNDGAASAPDHVAFTAETVAPEAVIEKPAISQLDYLAVGPRLTMRWGGSDPDGGGAKPVGYYYRLLDLRSLVPPVPIVIVDPGYLWRKGGVDSLWRYQSADTLEHTFFFDVPGSYVFGVRAVDEAGAVEPFLDYGRNAFKFQTLSTAGSPRVTLSEPSLGTFEFKGTPPSSEVAVAVGAVLNFRVSCSAEAYGGVCEAMRWGLDVPDLESDEGWSDWMPVGPLPPISIDHGGIHILYVEIRDDEDAVTLASLILNVVDFPMDRDVLFVDDSRDGVSPRDAEHDAFWQDLFDDSGRFAEDDVDVYAVYGPNDTYSRTPVPPTLAELGRYKLVVWECKGDGYSGDSGLWEVTTRNFRLPAYLRAGGKAWIGGTLTIAAMLPSSGFGADFTYPKEMVPGTFAWDFLKLYSTRIDNAKGLSTDDNLIGVEPFPGRPAIYPAMEQDPLKINPFAKSIAFGDAIFDPIFGQDVAAFTGQIDSLYVYKAVRTNRTYNNKLNAVRWHDPDPARLQGRVQWFGFPLYYMKKEQAQETFNRSIDWFREEGSLSR